MKRVIFKLKRTKNKNDYRSCLVSFFGNISNYKTSVFPLLKMYIFAPKRFDLLESVGVTLKIKYT